MDLNCLSADGGVDGFDGGDDNLVVITIIMQNKHTVVLPLPTSQTIFTFTLPVGSSVLLQTPKILSHKDKWSAFFLLPSSKDMEQTPHFYPSRILCQFLQIFLQSPCPEVPV